MQTHKIVSRDEWLVARKQHLANEKKLTHLHDELNAERRALPWVKVEKDYVFHTSDGKRTLGELFAGNSQLIVYHFMFGPDDAEGCPSCSFLADHMDGIDIHLRNHDVSLVTVSRAPLAKLEAFKQRMGWRFNWVSSYGSDFNFDYGVSFTKDDERRSQIHYNFQTQDWFHHELPGTSVFAKNAAGEVFHTYSSYARGCDILLGAHNYLDLTPKGRNEGPIMNWVRHHDKYPAEIARNDRASPQAAACCASVKETA